MHIMKQDQLPTVRLGERNYKPDRTWSRQDKIYLGKRCIGVIKLSSSDRRGRTISLHSKAEVTGRDIAWCINQLTLNPKA